MEAAPVHDFHPDCPDTLSCLPDTDGRPQHTLPVILRCAILGSPKKRLTIREIYAAMEEKYAYYRTAGQTWKQSVRHHLSLNRLFERQPRPVTDPGFGSYWTVNLAAPPGTKRPRKRGRPNKDGVNSTAGDAPGVPKKRGRPRKIDFVERANTVDLEDEEGEAMLPEDSAPEDDDNTIESEDEDDDYESEELVSPTDPRLPRYGSNMARITPAAKSGNTAHPTAAAAAARQNKFPVNPPAEMNDTSTAAVSRLRSEMAALRRQSTESSLRITDQLAEAQAECSRARAALRSAEAMLEDESRKRREAETLAGHEARMRRVAEEALRELREKWSSSERNSYS